MNYKKIFSGKEKIFDFHKIAAIIRKNFMVMIRDKARIIPLLLFPFTMIMIFGYTSGNVPKHLPAAIAVYDHSPLSERIQQGLHGNQLLAIRKEVSTEDQGKKMLDSGKIKVLIVIPNGLQEKIDRGEQAGIIITVDESEPSVANIVKQSIKHTINGISNEISVEKITSFQKSAEMSSQKLQNYNRATTNNYELIISKADSADASIEAANKKIKSMAKGIDDSIASPSTIPVQKVTASEPVYSNQSYLPETPAYLSSKGWVSALMQSSASLDSAKESVQAAAEIAKKEDEKLNEAREYKFYNDNLVEPGKAISRFAGYSPNTLSEPMVPEEKPAYGTGKKDIDFLIPSIIALTIFQGAIFGMGRAVAGERKEGSLMRVFLTPTSNATIILGTLLFYVIFEIFRSSFLILIAMSLFKIRIEGNLIAIFFIIVIYAAVSTAIGMFISTLVKSEQQYQGIATLVALPTIFLAGAFFPIQTMPKFLQGIAAFLPVTYAGDALRGVMIKGFSILTVSFDLLVLLVFFTLTLSLCFMVFKREVI